MLDLIVALGMGRFGGNIHPIHPAIVHFPIAFLIAASTIDLVTYAGLQSSSLLSPLVHLTTTSSLVSASELDTLALMNYLSLFSYASTIAALITAIPAVLTGLAEGYSMISVHGVNLSHPKIRTTAIHASLNDLAIGGALYNYLTRRGTDGFLIDGWNVAVSGVILVAVAYAGYLGGSLVFEYGIGVQRQWKGKGKGKEKGTKEASMQEKKEL